MLPASRAQFQKEELEGLIGVRSKAKSKNKSALSSHSGSKSRKGLGSKLQSKKKIIVEEESESGESGCVLFGIEVWK